MPFLSRPERLLPVALALIASSPLWTPGAALAQGAPSVVSACSGVRLPRSVVTDILAPVITGIATPTETTVNSVLGVVRVIPLVGQLLPPLSLNATGLLATAATGSDITLSVLNRSGQIVGPGDACNGQADSYSLTTARGLSIGGNQITGLGANGSPATAGEVNSIAFGNGATTDGGAVGAIAIGRSASVGLNATGSIALGSNASVTAVNSLALGAGSLASTGARTGYVATGLIGSQNSAGEVSFGAAGAARQLTNVAPGFAATDAVNVGQLDGVAASVTALSSTAVRYTDAFAGRVTLAGTSGTIIGNLAAGGLSAGSTEAVNGAQLFATNGLVAANAGAITTNATAVTTLYNNVVQGVLGPIRYSNAGTPTTPNGGTISNSLTLVGLAPGAVGLHSVAAGVVGAGSTDAVNGGQVFDLAGRLAGGFGGATTYNAGTNLLDVRLTYGGVTYTSVQDVLNSLSPAPGGAASPYLAVLSTGLAASASGVDSLAVGPGASVTAANSVALGSSSLAARGAQTGYAAIGLTALQSSAGEVSLGVAGAARQLTHVAAGSAATDAVNVGQLQGVSTRLSALADTSVRYTDVLAGRVVLAGATGTTITNLGTGSLTSASMDAVNGAQLFDTNTRVAANTTSILNNATEIANLRTALNLFAAPVVAGGPFISITATGGAAVASGVDMVAIGQDAAVTAHNSVALGNESAAARGARTAYVAMGMTALQSSAGEVSIGAAGAERQLTNVAAGTAWSDAVNVDQLQSVAGRIDAMAQTTVSYDNATRSTLTLAGAGGTTITNLTAGQITATSTDAVNGSQLFATNQNVAANTTAIANLTNNIANGSLGPIQYSNANAPTVGNGGVRTNDLTLVGASGGPIVLHNVGAGVIAAGSTDAVNGGQIHQLTMNAANAVQYDVNASGVRTGGVSLTGVNGAAVTINNVAAGAVTATSTQAVNGAQLFATNQAAGAAQTTANAAMAMGMNSVQYADPGRTTILLGQAGAPVRMSNLAQGVAPTDAVNVQQLNDEIRRAVSDASTYTDMRFALANFQMGRLRDELNAGTAGALAAAALPQIGEAGKGMMAVSFGAYEGQGAVAIGFSRSTPSGGAVMRAGATYDSEGRVGLNGGVGWRF